MEKLSSFLGPGLSDGGWGGRGYAGTSFDASRFMQIFVPEGSKVARTDTFY